MAVTVDTNILVYASNPSESVHKQAFELIETLVNGRELFYVFWPVIMGYLRVVTHPSVLPNPLKFETAAENIRALLSVPHVQSVGEREQFWDVLSSSAYSQLRGNDVPDLHLVALMRSNGVRKIFTRDRDFRRYDGIEPYDPFA